jgi:hypothetical protein
MIGWFIQYEEEKLRDRIEARTEPKPGEPIGQ